MATASWIQLMDKAAQTMVFNRFSSFLLMTSQNSDSVLCPHEIAMRKIAEKRSAGTTEFMSIWRYEPPRFDWNRQSTPIARKGLQMQYVTSSMSSKTGIVTVRAVPSVYKYTFRLWSRDFEKLSSATDSYLKWLHDNPQMKIYFSGLYEMDCYLKFYDVTDKTDYNIYDKGLNYIYEYSFEIEGWQLTSVTTPTILKIVLDLYLREGTSPNYSDTLIDEYIIEATT